MRLYLLSPLWLAELREWHRETQAAAAAAASAAAAAEAARRAHGRASGEEPRVPVIAKTNSNSSSTRNRSSSNSNSITQNSLEWKQEERRRRFGALARGHPSTSSPMAEGPPVPGRTSSPGSDCKRKRVASSVPNAEGPLDAPIEANSRQQGAPKARVEGTSGWSDARQAPAVAEEGSPSGYPSARPPVPTVKGGTAAGANEGASKLEEGTPSPPLLGRRRLTEDMEGSKRVMDASPPVEPVAAAASSGSQQKHLQQQVVTASKQGDRTSHVQATEGSKVADGGRERGTYSKVARHTEQPPQVPKEHRQQQVQQRSSSSSTESSHRRMKAPARDSLHAGSNTRRRSASVLDRSCSNNRGGSSSNRVDSSSYRRDRQPGREASGHCNATPPAAAASASPPEATTFRGKTGDLQLRHRSVSSSVSKCSKRSRSANRSRRRRSSTNSSRRNKKRSTSSSSISRHDARRRRGRDRNSTRRNDRRTSSSSSSSSSTPTREKSCSSNTRRDRSLSSRGSGGRKRRRSDSSGGSRLQTRRSVASRSHSSSGVDRRARGRSGNRRHRRTSSGRSPRGRGYREMPRQDWGRSTSRSAARSSVSDISNEGPPCRGPTSPHMSFRHRMYAQDGMAPEELSHPPVGWCGRSSPPHYVHNEAGLYHRAGQRRYHEEALPPHYQGEHPPTRNLSYGLDSCSPFGDGRHAPSMHAAPECPPLPLPRAEPHRHQRGQRGHRLFS